jgi:S1-C subfamily serine protease
VEWDDEGPDDAPVPPLLPPDDRIWRHPSEVAAGGGSVAPVALPPADRESSVVTVIVLTSCISVLLTLGVVTVVRPIRTRIAVEQIATPVSPVVNVARTADAAALAERLRPAVVQVVARTDGADAWGSGVVYRSDGMTLTAQHLVKGADVVRAILATGAEVAARVVGGDAETDVAVLDLEGDAGYEVAPLGDTAEVKVGESAVTIGRPSGAAGGPVVRVSVISALGQDVAADGHKLVDMMQTDSTVAPGSAGAPVVSTAGAVIGIATTNASTDAGMIGYATPIDVARAVAADLLANGHVTRGWLGVEGDSLAADRAHELGIPGGALVQKVRADSPAAAAGIGASDVITAIDDVAISSMSAVVVRLRTLRPSDTITQTEIHGTDTLNVKVTLAEKPS